MPKKISTLFLLIMWCRAMLMILSNVFVPCAIGAWFWQVVWKEWKDFARDGACTVALRIPSNVEALPCIFLAYTCLAIVGHLQTWVTGTLIFVVILFLSFHSFVIKLVYSGFFNHFLRFSQWSNLVFVIVDFSVIKSGEDWRAWSRE